MGPVRVSSTSLLQKDRTSNSAARRAGKSLLDDQTKASTHASVARPRSPARCTSLRPQPLSMKIGAAGPEDVKRLSGDLRRDYNQPNDLADAPDGRVYYTTPTSNQDAQRRLPPTRRVKSGAHHPPKIPNAFWSRRTARRSTSPTVSRSVFTPTRFSPTARLIRER